MFGMLQHAARHRWEAVQRLSAILHEVHDAEVLFTFRSTQSSLVIDARKYGVTTQRTRYAYTSSLHLDFTRNRMFVCAHCVRALAYTGGTEPGRGKVTNSLRT